MTAPVVTGLGAVGSWGAGPGALAAALAGGAPSLSAVERQAGLHPAHGARLAALAGEVELSAWLPQRLARRMSQPSRYAVAAGLMALGEAGLAQQPDGTTAVVLATAFGTARYAEELVRSILLQGPEAASPFLFSESVANAPAAQLAIACGARGASVAVTQRESGPLQALGIAAREVRLGRARLALAGACDEINPLVHAVLARFRALAGSAGGDEVARPFDRRRDGFLAAEGGAVLVLEREGDAVARGARLLARIRCTIRGFDATAPAHGWGAGEEQLAGALARGLARAGLRPADIDLVVSGASGARGGDRLEASVLRRLFRGEPPPVLAPKAVVGEYGGGHLAAAVLALQQGAPAAESAAFEPDPGLGLTPWVGELERPQRALVSSLAAGGAAAWAVLEAAG